MVCCTVVKIVGNHLGPAAVPLPEGLDPELLLSDQEGFEPINERHGAVLKAPSILSMSRAINLVISGVPDSRTQFVLRRLLGVGLDGSDIEAVRATDLANVLNVADTRISQLVKPWRPVLAQGAIAAMEGALRISPECRCLDVNPPESDVEHVRRLLGFNSWRTVRKAEDVSQRDVQIAALLHERRDGPSLDELVQLRCSSLFRRATSMDAFEQ